MTITVLTKQKENEMIGVKKKNGDGAFIWSIAVLFCGLWYPESQSAFLRCGWDAIDTHVFVCLKTSEKLL